MRALIPAGVLAVFSFWTGTFAGAATFRGAFVGQVVLLILVAGCAVDWRDPLALGRRGRWLSVALLGVVLASQVVSEVPRAGRTGVTLLAAFVLLPAALRGCWRESEERSRGLVGVGMVSGALAATSLIEMAVGGTERAALPLGHHNLLAAILVVSLPLTVAAARVAAGGWRFVLGFSVAIQLGAVLASRSFTALAALAVVAGITLAAEGRWRLAALGLLFLVPGLPRVVDWVAGSDGSLTARATYARAAWNGIVERPGLGWGPGATPWTLALHLEPVPGVNPPSEVVGEVHSLPLGLVYELGVAGGLLAAGVVLCFAARRWREIRHLDRTVAIVPLAGLAALAGGAVVALGASALSVPAVPVSWALASAVAMSGGRLRGVSRGWVPGLYALAAAGLLAGPWAAHFHYDQAAAISEEPSTAAALERAWALDPSFPLYPARLAWFRFDEGESSAAVTMALAAADGAPGVAALQLSAGVLALEAGDARGEELLRRAMALDPLSGLAPFYLAAAAPQARTWTACAARALLAEPALAASTYWDGQKDRLAAVRAEILRWPGVDAGLRQELADRLGRAWPEADAGEAWWEVGREDERGGLSRDAFRRRPWRREWFAEPVHAAGLSRFDLPGAATISGTTSEALPPDRCAPISFPAP